MARGFYPTSLAEKHLVATTGVTRYFSDGRHVLRFEPQAFVARLCALVPPRRFHMVRYAGLFAPHSRGRFALTGRGLHDAKEPGDANWTGPLYCIAPSASTPCCAPPAAHE